ncbi:MAG: hypothetical protein COS85_18525, partial [Armatimonadetes bacterium CG07_land_8_20_14_0_80_59_28]
SNRPLVVTGSFGEGRTVLLGWDGTLTPAPSAAPRLQFEQGLAMTLRAITYAAKKEPPVQVEPQPSTLAAGKGGEVVVRTSGAAKLHCVLREASFDAVTETVVSGRGGDDRVTLPSLPSGKYWLEVIARDDKGASLGWGSAAMQVEGDAKVTVKTDKDVYRQGETVRVTASVEGAVANPMVQMRIEDAAGRLLAEGVAQKMGEHYTFNYKIADARVAPHTVTATLLDGKNALGRERVQFFVPNNTWDDYHNMLWPQRVEEMNVQMRDIGGLTAVMESWARDEMSRDGAKVGIVPCHMNEGVLNPGLMQTDPVKGETEQDNNLKGAIEVARKYGSLVWAQQDERHQMGDPGIPNEEGLRRYREYLKAQYGTVEKLNASWGANLKSWDEAQPMLTKELTPETKNLAPWVDLRLHVADQCFRADKRHADRVRAAFGKETPIGIDGFTSSGHVIPFGGVDIGRLLGEGVFNFYCPYGDDLMIASMCKGPMVKYIGWGMSRRQYFGQPWRDAFRGHWGTFRFFGPTFISQFGWMQPAGRWIAEGTKELRGGVGKALMKAKRQNDPVAILYSYPSMITTAGAGIWVEKGNAHLMWRPANWSRDAWEQMLLACGNSFGYLTDKQVEQGGLKGRKLLIIPHFMGIALSDATCAAIREFVNGGGVVVADLAPAVCDEHGRLRDKGGLDDLFGCTRETFAYQQRASDYLVGVTESDALVPRNAWYVGEWYEKNLKVTDGKPLGKHWFQDIPAMVVKDTGKGRALLLNFLHTSMVRRNGEPEDDDIRLIELLLKEAGVTPQARTETDYGKQERFCEINTLRDGAIEYVGAYAWKMPTEDPAKMVIRFPSSRNTYDVRGGKFLGKVDRAPLPLRAQEAALFARLDYEVTGVNGTATSANRGDAVTVAVNLATSAKPGRHVVNVEVTDPEGKRNYFYSRNVELLDGKWSGRIHTALNDAKGNWSIVVREAISGKTAKVSFRLR